jgi:hypothetical protein
MWTACPNRNAELAACMRWAEFRGPGLANRLQTAIFGDRSGICKTRIQQHEAAAAEFGTFLLKTARPMQMAPESLSIDKLNRKTGALHVAFLHWELAAARLPSTVAGEQRAVKSAGGRALHAPFPETAAAPQWTGPTRSRKSRLSLSILSSVKR